MFQKIVAVEPVGLVPDARAALKEYAEEVVFYEDIPATDEEIIRRVGDADGVLLSYTSSISRRVLEQCSGIRYIGMCCSLYSPESANVDIRAAEEKGIVVRGIRDYGDEGVLEYVVSELVRLLHGFGQARWKELPLEITGLKVGIVGLGTTGQLLARGLRFFGADVSYYSRTRKSEWEAKGLRYFPLHGLLGWADVVCTCLNKNTVLLGGEEFAVLGNHKILFNTSVGPSFTTEALRVWLDNSDTYFFCDTKMALGDTTEKLLDHPRVFCAGQSAGMTAQATERLSRKVLDNIRAFLDGGGNPA